MSRPSPSTDSSSKPSKAHRISIVGALAAAIPALAAGVHNYFETSAATERLQMQQAAMVAQQDDSNEAWELMTETINRHEETLGELRQCRVDIAVLQEWRKGVDKSMERWGSRRRRSEAPHTHPAPTPAANTITIPIQDETPAPLPKRRPDKAAEILRQIQSAD